MQEILFCDECGRRIREGEQPLRMQQKTCCPTCGQKHLAETSRQAGSPVPARPKSGAQAKGRPPSDRPPRTEAAAAPVAGPRSPERRSGRAAPPPQEGARVSPIVPIAGIAVAIGLIGGALFFYFSARGSQPESRTADRGKPVRKAEPPQPDPWKPETRPPPPKIEPTPVPPRPADDGNAGKKAESPMEEIREQLARKKYDEIKAKEGEGKLSAWDVRKLYEDFAGSSYGNTGAGREAAERLKAMPKAEKPPEPAPGPHKVLWTMNFDSEEEAGQVWSIGLAEKQEPFGGKGMSWKSAAMQKQGWFTGQMNLNLAAKLDRLPVISDKSWIRFAYRLQGGGELCIHAKFGGTIFETWTRGLVQDKWAWTCIKVSDFKKKIYGDAEELKPGMTFEGAMIYSGANNKPSTLWLDEFTLGDGEVPADPK